MLSKIYEKIDEYASQEINPFEQIARGDPNVGYVRKSDNMIHCGNNVFISKTEYDNGKNKLYTYSKKDRKGSEFSGFVRHIAETIFGWETLKNSSVTGKKCGRTKTPAKPPLDPTLLGAVIAIFRYYLAVDMKLDPVRVAQELHKTGEHIAGKIGDMNRKKRQTHEEEIKNYQSEKEYELLIAPTADEDNRSDNGEQATEVNADEKNDNDESNEEDDNNSNNSGDEESDSDNDENAEANDSGSLSEDE